jgi:hypothetical protein
MRGNTTGATPPRPSSHLCFTTKGDLVEPPPYYIAQPCLVYAQKPADPFSAEREYRYSLQAKHSSEPEPYLTLYVPCNDICNFVALERARAAS